MQLEERNLLLMLEVLFYDVSKGLFLYWKLWIIYLTAKTLIFWASHIYFNPKGYNCMAN